MNTRAEAERVLPNSFVEMPSKELIAKSFCAAAGAYDLSAEFQRRVGFELLERVPMCPLPARVLDVGTGTGFLAAEIERRVPLAQMFALDIAEGMLQKARTRLKGSCLVGDAEILPVSSESMDLVVSNLAIQWCHSLERTFGEFARVLKKGGYVCFSTFGVNTLNELKAAWASVDNQSHVNDFQTYSAISEALTRSGLRVEFLVETQIQVEYPSALALMRELKGLGAHNINLDRPRYLTGRCRFTRMMESYQLVAGNEDGSVSATFHVVVGVARRGAR